jgi:1,4-alpha-glucan branching enzyme
VYRYLPPDLIHSIRLPRAQSNMHGPSVVVDPASYKWRNEHWRGRPCKDAVLTNRTSAFSVVLAEWFRELPRLAVLGITAVELMPVAESPAPVTGATTACPLHPKAVAGKPDDLKSLVDAAHDNGLMIFFDVVYKPLRPDGNYLKWLTQLMFRSDVTTPWGPAIDSQKEVRRSSSKTHYWLIEYRFDGCASTLSRHH